MNKNKSIYLKDENGKIYYGWWIVLAAAVITGFVYSGIVSVIGVFMLPVTTDLNISIGSFSFYLTIMSIANIVTLALVSKFFNQKYLKKVMTAAGILVIISFIGFAMAKGLTAFYIFAIPQGIGFACMTQAPCQTVVSNWFGEKEKGRAIAFYLTGMMIGQVIELNLLNVIVANMGWRAAYIALAICTVISVLAVIFLIKWSPEEVGIQRMGELSDEEKVTMQNALEVGTDFKDIVKKPLTWLVFITCSLTTIVSSSIVSHGIPTMVMGGFAQERATQIMSIVAFLVAIVGPVFGVICDKVKLQIPVVVAGVGFAFSALGLALVNVSQSAVWMYAVFYLVGIGSLNVIPPLIAAYMYGEKEMPRMVGYINIFIGIGGAIGAAGVGMLYDVYGSYQKPWLYMAAVMILVAVIRGIATTKNRKFKPEEKTETAN